MTQLKPIKYDLSGGSEVLVCKPFGERTYFAYVNMPTGRYPEEGKIAHNVGRDECSLVIEGKFFYQINEETITVEPGEMVLVKNGDRYSITGSGKVIVFVEDQTNGRTEVVDI